MKNQINNLLVIDSPYWHGLSLKKIATLLVIVLGYSSLGYSQFQCDVIPTHDEQEVLDDRANAECNNFLNYIPDDETPMKWVKVNIHFVQNEDDTNPMNFAETWDGVNTASTMNGYVFAENVINYANTLLVGNLQENMPPGNTIPVIDPHYRLSLQSVYFDQGQWGNVFPEDLNLIFGVNVASEINIYFTSHALNNQGATGGMANMGGNRCCTINGTWNDYYNGNSACLAVASFTVLHETGHNLGLLHPLLTSNGICTLGNNDQISDTSTIEDIENTFGFNPCCGSGVQSDFCDNNLMNYSQLVAITPMQLAKIHYTLTHNMINYLDEDYYCANNPSEVVTIESGQQLTWNNVRVMRGDLIVQPNASLTVRCYVYMPADSKVIVMPGGQLFVDGGSFTNRCGLLWSGVEVWGNRNVGQTYANQGLFQSYNDALIENARIGIRTIKNEGATLYENLDWLKTGGIIKASYTTFRNNLKSIEFMSYHNINSQGLQINNTSTFSACKFLTDANNNFSGGTINYAMTMWDVLGISIAGCEFDYQIPVGSYDQRGNGLLTLKSTFRIGDFGSTRTKFSNLNRAIDATGPLKLFYPTIDHAQFINNRAGVWLTSFGLSKTTRNDFDFVEITEPDNEPTYGLYLQNCYGYRVEENNFNGHEGNRTYGVAVNSSGNHTNLIYKNFFKNLHVASIVYGDNRIDNQVGWPGLEWNCNKYGDADGSTNTYHQVLWGATANPQVLPPASMAYYQETLANMSAENTFYPECVFGNDDHELKLMEQVDPSYFMYFYRNQAQYKPDCHTIGIQISPSITIPSTYKTCSSKLNAVHPISLIQTEIAQSKLLEADLKLVYDGYINNGSGQYLKQLLANPSSSSLALRNSLLDASPKVADDLLIELIHRTPQMEGLHLAQVLIANTPVQDRVLVELEKSEYADDYKDLVALSVSDGISNKVLMEIDFASTLTNRLQLEYEYLASQDLEAGANWNQLSSDIDNDLFEFTEIDRVLISIEQGDATETEILVNSLAQISNEEKQLLLQLLSIQQSGILDQRAISSIEESMSSSDDLKEMFQVSLMKMKSFIGLQNYDEFLTIPEDGKMLSKRLKQHAPSSSINAFPVPAKDLIFIPIGPILQADESEVFVTDISGVLMLRSHVAANTQIFSINCTDWPSGVYTYSVQNSKGRSISSTFIISK